MNPPVILSACLKLAVAPVVTGLVLTTLGFEATLVDRLIVSAAAPGGVTVAIMAAQTECEVDFAAAVVFVTTLLSPMTVTLCLFLLS